VTEVSLKCVCVLQHTSWSRLCLDRVLTSGKPVLNTGCFSFSVSVTELCVVFSGYGIFARKTFDPGDFLLEYVGNVIDPIAAGDLVDQTYVYYFSWGSKKCRLIYDIYNIVGSVICLSE